MTLDLIYGDSIQAKPFAGMLDHWRSDLFNLSSEKLDAYQWTSIEVNDANGYLNWLKVEKGVLVVQIVQDEVTPMQAGQYLEIKFEVSIFSGVGADFKVIGAPADANGVALTGYTIAGPTTSVVEGQRLEVSAIVGSGTRQGVDLPWGKEVTGGYFGLEITGANGATIYVSNMKVTNVTGHFLAANSDWVDIRDYGAIGDGVTDCYSAFVAADAEADGRAVFIPEGDYFIGTPITIHAPIRAYGRIVTDETTPVMLAHEYNVEVYIHAFKDESLGFIKALQALYHFNDHISLDLCGRRIGIAAPIDVAALSGITKFNGLRMIQNGQFEALDSTAWDSNVVNSTASYSNLYPDELVNVAGIEDIEAGSLVQGNGVGRAVYVVEKDETAGSLKLSDVPFDPSTNQSYTFTRFRFMLDYSGFEVLRNQSFQGIEFACERRASAVMLPYFAQAFRVETCWIDKPRDRGLCSYHQGANDLVIQNCRFSSGQKGIAPHLRTTIGFNTRKNDLKCFNNVAEYFRHFGVIGAACTLISGNHVYQGANGSQRLAGFVISETNPNATIMGNYIDNCMIEYTNEHNRKTDNRNFGNLTIIGNYFLMTGVDSWARFIKVAPVGNAQRLNRINVEGNLFFGDINTTIDRVEGIDTTNGTIDSSRSRFIRFTNNAFNSIGNITESPTSRKITQTSAQSVWTESFADVLPFSGQVLGAQSVIGHDDLSGRNWPLVRLQQGGNGASLGLDFGASTSGSVTATVSCSQD